MSAKSYIGRKEFNLKLIDEVQKYKYFYDHAHPDYRNCVLKARTWKNIAHCLGASDHLCKQRWRDLRKQYLRELSKPETPGTIRSTHWRYTDAMNFLKVHEMPETNTKSKSDNFCRACLCPFPNTTDEECKKYNIFEMPDFAEKMSKCSNTPVVQYDEYPQFVCEKCCKTILFISQFQTKCRNSLEKYNAMLHDPNQVSYDLANTLAHDSVVKLNDDSNFVEDIDVSNEIKAIEIYQKATKGNRSERGAISANRQLHPLTIDEDITADCAEEDMCGSTTNRRKLLSVSEDIEYVEISEDSVPCENRNNLEENFNGKNNEIHITTIEVLPRNTAGFIRNEEKTSNMECHEFIVDNNSNSSEYEEFIMEELLELDEFENNSKKDDEIK